MKFLFFTDTHIRGTNPRGRTDDFYQTLIAKMNEVIEIADEQNIDYILHGGDWFDRPDTSPAVVRDFAMIIKRFNRPIYTVAGNHDIYGHNPHTISRTMLGLLEAIGIIKLIEHGEKIFIEKDGVTVQLTGSPYDTEIDGEKYRDFYIVEKEKKADYAINMVHGMLLNKPFFEGIKYTLADDIADTEADITLAGHYHAGFGIINKGSRYIINPGGLVRISASKAEMERVPGVILIELTKQDVNVEFRELKSARNGEEVLDRTAIETAQDRNIKLYSFFNEINKTENFNKMDLQSIIQQIADNKEIKKEVRTEAIKRIEYARESLAKGEET